MQICKTPATVQVHVSVMGNTWDFEKDTFEDAIGTLEGIMEDVRSVGRTISTSPKTSMPER